MTGTNHKSAKLVSDHARPLGNTEQNWCRAVASGTGITVLALQMAKAPAEMAAALASILHKLQTRHPLLAARLHYNATTKTFSFLKATTPPPHKTITLYDTSRVLRLHSGAGRDDPAVVSPFQTILEHELNSDCWSDPNSFPCNGIEVLHAAVYEASDTKSVVVLRFHTSVCDRATAVSVLRELMEMFGGSGTQKGIKKEEEGHMGIESLIPGGVAKKTLWSHGIDMLGYSVNSFRLTNLTFENTKLPRRSEVVRLQMSSKYTTMILEGCKSRGIKLCGALAAAAIIAAHSTKLDNVSDAKKYGVVTLTDCRSTLEPPLSPHDYGFYHSAILNIHRVKGAENVWDLAKKCYRELADSKRCKKQFSDMGDLNFLMWKAIDNPSLTASSSLRTSLLTVFEDPVVDDALQMQQMIGAEDYMGCASVHGVGPSLALFDTLRAGELDCACVYPAPLHSRDQITALVARMTEVLIDGATAL